MNMNERRLGGRKKWGVEDRRKEKRGGAACLFELVRPRTVRCGLCPVPRFLKGIILSKKPSLNSKLLPPPRKKKFIFKWLAYPEGTFWYAQRTCAEGKQFVQIWQATPSLLEWGKEPSSLLPPQNRNRTNKSCMRKRLHVVVRVIFFRSPLKIIIGSINIKKETILQVEFKMENKVIKLLSFQRKQSILKHYVLSPLFLSTFKGREE